ncbi:hypothetical protein LTR78_008159 [Recurvomyces mirabilis]|uniref:polynucleotide adenylyltransferase n=1 Tax=Recurvomyces mirabilis TaxID=574656 RepID=A0AAE0WHT7_9PEZI|nr:hypothetical protein LTR78_008159 [Recurvomyces mirabilis]KAK5150642.1 hypothetical protein LTS14_009925 [Recurvomyces mirabilis]
MAGQASADRLNINNGNNPKITATGVARPAMQSTHSSSVPSTPSQQPRRFHSRSPSPHRGLGNQSPRSVVSEAVGQNGIPRSQPNFCKYESGAEFRKRRIPYTEGGENELGPPKKEPKKALEPHEDDKLSGDMRELYDRLLPSDESEQRRAQLIKKLEKMMSDEWPGHDIRVNVFGSSGNLLNSSDSDADICITTPLKKLESMHGLAALLDRHGMQKVVCRASAKVPIVKCWDPELRLACDLNVNNPLALENTRMIKTYVQLDDRIRPLAKIIKYWTKRRILNDAAYGGTISSYTWICMIISFLQRREPQIIPSLQNTDGKRLKTDRNEPTRFADDIDALKGCGNKNRESLAQLLFQFFRHYGYEFDYSRYVVSVREGRLVSREEKGWQTSNYHEKEAQRRLCVEEPFTKSRNLGNSADDYSWSGVHQEIRRAFELLADGQQLEKCCEEYEFPPEEKPIFQRPAQKPPPTLRRSASQSGRSNHEQGSSRPRKSNNRNQSTQRAGNRRASSGATFGNPRMPLQSPSIGLTSADYFGARSSVHEYLSHQYQLLQAHREALTAQLQQHQQATQQGQPQSHRVGDLNGSPLHRGGAFQNGLPSPRFLDNPPQTAPLLPGYLYHYPARYPPPSPMSQARSREGTSTNPSSPSLVAATPVQLRRQVHRASVTDGSSSSARSQSQPGRSLPHPLALQQQAHPGYDVSGVIPASYQNMRNNPAYAAGQAALQTQYGQIPGVHFAPGSVDSAMPKEYMGYGVGSPQFGGQYAVAGQQIHVPPMTLHDPPPSRQRRVTPDLQPPMPNGRHISRSPSPLGHLRSYSTAADLRTRAQAQAEMLGSPSAGYEATSPFSTMLAAPVDIGGPLIVNGSTPAATPKLVERINGVPILAPLQVDSANVMLEQDPARPPTLPLRTSNPEMPENKQPSPPQVASSPMRLKNGPRLALSPNGLTQSTNGLGLSDFHDPALTAPLLSPVAELRTPSPTQAHVFDKQESPQANGLVKVVQIANARNSFDRKENDRPAKAASATTSPRHERQGSAPNAGAKQITTNLNSNTVKGGSVPLTPVSAGDNQQSLGRQENPWMQVQSGKKGHKKSKSSVVQGRHAQAVAVGEGEKKGG